MMQDNQNGIRWHLELGGELIARISDSHDYAFPFTYGVVIDSPKFERFRTFFTDPETWPDDDPKIEALCREVQDRGGFQLRDLQTGIVHKSITINQNSSLVWFRIG